MKLSRIICHIFLFGIWCLVIGTYESVSALYDPRTLPTNKLGVHILDPGEIDQAAKLVNSQGGDWGYITVPIQPNDRDKAKWQSFMQKARELHLIPIIRITTVPQGGTWEEAGDTDLVDFANFLSELTWPIQNRYIVLFNEVNRAAEWGGTVDPEKYALIVKNAYTIFKERSPNYFLLGPALDLALPSSTSSLSATTYFTRMTRFDPLVWTYFDGWASHSYPNPAFSASPSRTGLTSIVGYKTELSYLKLAPKPVFITETGWDQSKLSASVLESYWQSAWKIWQNDPNVVAVTPFVLSGGEQFASLSLTNPEGQLKPSGQVLSKLEKTLGTPIIETEVTKKATGSAARQPIWEMPIFRDNQILIKLENIFRTILNLPRKASGDLAGVPLSLELAETPKQWEKGLSGRTSLRQGSGMLFIFSTHHVPVFWMKDTLIPLDMIWISDSSVVDITHSVPISTSVPLPTYSPSVPVNMVLETPAGWAKDNDIKVGDKLTIEI